MRSSQCLPLFFSLSLLLVLLLLVDQSSGDCKAYGESRVCSGNGICQANNDCLCLDLSSGNYFDSVLNGTFPQETKLFNPQRSRYLFLTSQGVLQLINNQTGVSDFFHSNINLSGGSGYSLLLDNTNGQLKLQTSVQTDKISDPCPVGSTGPFKLVVSEKSIHIYDSLGTICWDTSGSNSAPAPAMYNGPFCSSPICYNKNAIDACSKKGTCVSYNTCDCMAGYIGKQCDRTLSCNGRDFNDVNVCSGNGVCILLNKCQCNDKFYGGDCSINGYTILISLPTNDIHIARNDNLQLTLGAIFNYSNESLTTSELSEYNFTWKCVNCNPPNSRSVFNWGDWSSLSISGSTYMFTVETYKNVSNSMVRASNLLSFNVTVHDQKITKYGIPSYFIKNKDHNVDGVIGGVEYLANTKLFTQCPKKCTIPLTVTITLTTSKASNLLKSSFITTGEYDGIGSFKFNPLLPLTGSFNINEDELILSVVISRSNEISLLISEKIPVYQKPVITGNQFTITTGNSTVYALKTPVKFNTRPFFTINVVLLPIQIAIGFQYTDKSNVRISKYALSLDSVYLPYFTGSPTIILFARDSQGFEYIQELEGDLKVLPYPDSRDLLLERMKSDSKLSAVVPYDSNFIDKISESSVLETVKSLEIPFENPSTTIETLKTLVSNSKSVVSSSSLIASKIESYILNLTASYKNQFDSFGFVKEKVISKSDLNSLLSTSSNLFSQGNTNVSRIFEKVTKLALLGDIPQLLSNSAQPSISKRIFTSESVDIYTSNVIKRDQVASSEKFKFSDVSIDLDNVMAAYDSYSKQLGMSLIKYAKNIRPDNFSSTNSLSIFTEFSIYKEGNLLEIKDLTKPFIINLPLSNNTIVNSSIACKYWNESTQSWESNGCQFLSSDSLSIQCECNHTTLFSAFVEINTTRSDPKELQVVYITQIVYGSIFFIVSCVLMILLIAFRNYQPVKSRFVTPFIGMSAMIIQTALLLITQKSVLLYGQIQVNGPQSSTVSWEYGDLAANILSNIIAIVVNSISITAFVAYLYQVTRFQLLKYLYHKLVLFAIDKKGARLIKVVKGFLSTRIMLLGLIGSFIGNLMYWTLWVALVRTKVLDSQDYTYVVSISFTCIILSICLLIVGLIILDYSISFFQKKEEIISILTNMDTKKKTNFILQPAKQVANWYSRVDSPLYFRVEMIFFVLCFIFLACNQIIGLSGISSKKRMIVNDSVSMAFEILYLASYCLVFGGYSLIVLLVSKLRKKEDNGEEFSELVSFLDSAEGLSLMEWFCKKEFSLENVQLYTYLKQNESALRGGIKEVKSFFSTLFESYIKTGSISEVNIPSNLKKNLTSILSELDSNTIELSTAKDGKSTENSRIKECIDALKSEVLMNLQDSYSRLVFTTEYSSYHDIQNSKKDLLKQSNFN